MTKKQALLKLKELFRNAQTVHLKSIKETYAKVKSLNISDNDPIPEDIENTISGF